MASCRQNAEVEGSLYSYEGGVSFQYFSFLYFFFGAYLKFQCGANNTIRKF